MADPSIDLELQFHDPHEPLHPLVYEVVDGRWRATQVTRLGRCVATGDTLRAVNEALAELVRLQFTEECHDAEARDLLRRTA
jgi:hypothetical protein